MDTSSREQERNEEHDEEEEEEEEEATTNEATTTNNETIIPQNDPNKNKKCKGNPSGITRLFLGNLPFSVDEDSLETFLQPAALTHIKWITDKETGKFYGSAFVEMRNSKDAAIVVVDKNGTNLMDRPIKANYAPSRPGDVWPPKSKVWTAGKQRSAGGSGVKAMSPKPEGCTKLFIGNLSYDIDDEGITKFFGNVDAEIKAVRWISHKDTGDFKGVGFVEFWNTEACEKAATLNGKTLLGRPIRIDWDASNVN
uniref:RRM domain-containing protein n=1 Tax=Ditylum brightwellii TaxID=49249 RepID=A0A7S4VRX9_9STRA